MFLHLMERTGNWSIFYGMNFWILHDDYDGDGDDNMKVMVMVMIMMCVCMFGGGPFLKSTEVEGYSIMPECKSYGQSSTNK